MVRLSFISNKISSHRSLLEICTGISPPNDIYKDNDKTIKRIFFYSIHGTNGDLFTSMPFVNDIANKVNDVSVEYAFNSHLNSNFKYQFVNNVITHNTFEELSVIGDNTFMSFLNGTLYVNTWIGSLPSFKSSGNKLVVQSLYGYYLDFKKVYDRLNIKLERNVDFYIPTWLWNLRIPDYSSIETQIKLINKTKILLCNGIGYTNPHQYPGESINNLLKYLFNSNYFVIVTNPELLHNNETINKLYLSQLTEYLDHDSFSHSKPFYINEVYAKNCDIIIGSASGLFLSLMTLHTFEKKFILYSNDGKFFVHERFNLNYITDYNKDTFVSKLDSLFLSEEFNNYA